MNERKKPEVLLENWTRCGVRLYGQFYRHAVIPDGTYAHTSRLIFVGKNEEIAESENTLYSLGKAVRLKHKCYFNKYGK